MGDGSIRMRRINEAIKEVLSASIGKGLKDPRIGFVTVTGVETSPDLSGAKVFVSVYGKQSEKEETLEGLRSSEGFLQQEINEHLRMNRDIATALYVGLITDTGGFQYSSTSYRSHEVAAELLKSGVDVASISRHLYQTVPLPKLRLLQRVLERMQIRLEGAMAISWLTAEDFADSEADESHVEGLVDNLRAIAGVRVGVLIREREVDGKRKHRVSLRASDGSVDVASVAHLYGGGGHVDAAGFSAEMDLESLLNALDDEVGARL